MTERQERRSGAASKRDTGWVAAIALSLAGRSEANPRRNPQPPPFSPCIRLSGLISFPPLPPNSLHRRFFMSLAQTLLPEFDQEVKNTRKLLECVPDGKFDYKPHERSMTLGRLAAHVAEMPNYLISTLRHERLDFTGEEKPFAPATRKELLESFDKFSAEARDLLAQATDEDLAKVWTLT